MQPPLTAFCLDTYTSLADVVTCTLYFCSLGNELLIEHFLLLQQIQVQVGLLAKSEDSEAIGLGSDASTFTFVRTLFQHSNPWSISLQT